MFYACTRIDYECEWLEIGWRTNFIWYRVGQVYAARSATRLLAMVVLDEGMVVDVVELAALRFARLYGRYQLSQFVADVVVPWYVAYGVFSPADNHSGRSSYRLDDTVSSDPV